MLDDLKRHGGTIVPYHAARVRRVATLVGVAGVPVIFLRFTNDPFNVPKLALLMAVVAVGTTALAIEWLQGARFPALRTMAIPALVLAVPLLIATALSPYRWWALFGEYQRFQGFIPNLLVVALGILVAVTFAGNAETPARWLVIAGAIAGGYSVAQYLGVDLFQWAQQFGGEVSVTSTLGNTNFSGGFLAICLPISVAIWMGEPSLGKVWTIVLITGGLLVSFSQGAWVAAVGGILFAGGLHFSDRIRMIRFFGAVLAGLLALGSLGYVVKGIVEASDQAAADTVQLRSWWWESAIEMTFDHPIVGHGPNSFAVDSWGYRSPEESASLGFDYTNDPHSGYLAMLTGAGVIGLGGLLVVLGWGLRRAWSGGGDLMTAAAGGAIVAYATDILTTVDELALRSTLWVCLGILVSASLPIQDAPPLLATSKRGKRSQPKSTPLLRPAAVAGVAVAGFMLAGYGVALVVADAEVKSGIRAFRTGEVSDARGSFDMAISIWPSSSYKHSYAFFLGELAGSRKDGRLIEASSEMYSYLENFPDVAGLRDAGRTFFTFSRFRRSWLATSAEHYERAITIDPYNYTLTIEGTPVLLEAERYEQIVTLVAPVIEVLGEKAPSLWTALARSYFELGNEEQARAALDQALALMPEDPATLQLADEMGNP